MATLRTVAEGYMASREWDNATLGRLAFWVDEFGDTDLAALTTDEVDAAVVRLAERGKLRAGRGLATERTGQPLAGSTLNRYIGQLSSLYKYARRLRLLPRSHVPPTRGIEKAPETTHHDRFFTAAEIDRLVKVARVVDTRWRKMPAFIRVAYCTGLRKSNLLSIRWSDVDLDSRTVKVARTKNGSPHVAALSDAALRELRALPGKEPDAYVFEGRRGRPQDIRRLWDRITKESSLTGRGVHALRHSCGHALATAGVGQAGIMQVMGHRTLSASARYVHANPADKLRIVAEVFG